MYNTFQNKINCVYRFHYSQNYYSSCYSIFKYFDCFFFPSEVVKFGLCMLDVTYCSNELKPKSSISRQLRRPRPKSPNIDICHQTCIAEAQLKCRDFGSTFGKALHPPSDHHLVSQYTPFKYTFEVHSHKKNPHKVCHQLCCVCNSTKKIVKDIKGSYKLA